VEHVVSYPGDYNPAFAFSAIRCPLAVHVSCDTLTWSNPSRRPTGLPSSTAMT